MFISTLVSEAVRLRVHEKGLPSVGSRNRDDIRDAALESLQTPHGYGLLHGDVEFGNARAERVISSSKEEIKETGRAFGSI